MQGNQSNTKPSLCTLKGGMETLGGNGVNPGYKTKKLMPKFPRVSPTNEIIKQKTEIL